MKNRLLVDALGFLAEGWQCLWRERGWGGRTANGFSQTFSVHRPHCLHFWSI